MRCNNIFQTFLTLHRYNIQDMCSMYKYFFYMMLQVTLLLYLTTLWYKKMMNSLSKLFNYTSLLIEVILVNLISLLKQSN